MMLKQEKINWDLLNGLHKGLFSDFLYRFGNCDLMHITQEGETFNTIADKYQAVKSASGISRQKFIEQIKKDNPDLRIWTPLIEPRQIMRIRFRITGRSYTCKNAHDDLLAANKYFQFLLPSEQRLIQNHSEELLS